MADQDPHEPLPVETLMAERERAAAYEAGRRDGIRAGLHEVAVILRQLADKLDARAAAPLVEKSRIVTPSGTRQ